MFGGSAARVAIVTGGAQGIGLATCEALVGEGLCVAVADLDHERAVASAARLDGSGGRCLPVEVDVASGPSVVRMIRSVIDAFRRIDVLVNNAGTIDPRPSPDVEDLDWDRLVGVHLGGAFRCARSAFPALTASGAGAVVNVGSIAGRLGISDRASYCAAKAGIEGLTRELAVEWAPYGIRVNAVAPGYTLTPLVRRAFAEGMASEERLKARIPLGRLGNAAEPAAAIAFLASEKASFITGQTLVVDGGMVVNGNC